MGKGRIRTELTNEDILFQPPVRSTMTRGEIAAAKMQALVDESHFPKNPRRNSDVTSKSFGIVSQVQADEKGKSEEAAPTKETESFGIVSQVQMDEKGKSEEAAPTKETDKPAPETRPSTLARVGTAFGGALVRTGMLVTIAGSMMFQVDDGSPAPAQCKHNPNVGIATLLIGEVSVILGIMMKSLVREFTN